MLAIYRLLQRIALGDKDHAFQLLDNTYVLVLPGHFDSDSTPHLTVYSLSPSSGSSSSQPICSLQLPGVTLAPGKRISYRDVCVSRPPPIPEGHFQADPSVSMVVITDYIEVGGHPSHSDYASHLLIPYATLLAQIRTAVDSNSNRDVCEYPVPVLWEDWGPRASLRLCVPVVGDRSDPMIVHQILVPYGSRMPVVSFNDPGSTCASVYVFDINPLAARYAQQALRASAQPESGVRATAIVEDSDVEAALPGVVDPDIKGIPFVVYRFELPQEDPGWPAVRAVRMSMTGFTVTVRLLQDYHSASRYPCSMIARCSMVDTDPM
uniref:Cyclin n=1 Tax=Ganoderma boninense TaxID=34458 RepID=A0A5K1K6K0_9APHY|nr:Cyclin [Ganoderma boninense]